MPTPDPEQSIRLHPDQQSDLEAVAEGLLDRLINHMAQEASAPPVDALLSAQANAVRILGRAAIARLTLLQPGISIALHSAAVGSVVAYHAGEMIAGFEGLTRIALVPQLADQLAAGVNSGRPCNCRNCKPRWGERS